MCRFFWALLGCTWLLFYPSALDPHAAHAQGMMDHVDLSSPRMSGADLQRGDIERLIAAGGSVMLADKSLNGLDLSGLDLRGADLRWARLNRTSLAGARLDGARLDLAWGIEADFSGASLKDATLFQAQLLRARMDGADLSGARIPANFESASMVGTRLVGADGSPDMRNQSMGLMRAILRLAKLQGADLTDAELNRADMEYAKLQGAKLQGADLTMAKLGGANLTGAELAGCDLTGAAIASAIFLQAHGLSEVVGLDRTIHRDRAFFDPTN